MGFLFYFKSLVALTICETLNLTASSQINIWTLKLGQIKIRTKWLSKAVSNERREPKERKTRSLKGEWGNGGSHLLSPPGTLPWSHCLLIMIKGLKVVMGGNYPLCHSRKDCCTKVCDLLTVKEIRHDSINSNLSNISLSLMGISFIIYYEN